MSDDRNQQISERAHRLWESEGQPRGRALDHWLEAERQIGAKAPSGESESANEGEGNRSAARSYNRKATAFAQNSPVERLARKAQADLEGPEGESLRQAEAIGRSHSHGDSSDIMPPKQK